MPHAPSPTTFPESPVEGLGAKENHPENRLWFESGVAFASVHQVGSNNALTPRRADRQSSGNRESSEQYALRLAAFERRDAANVAWLHETFALAERGRANEGA